MTTALARSEQDQDRFSVIEQVVVSGNLAELTAQQRVMYYNRVCESMGLNPYSQPFDYITLNGKLRLYAKKDATEQLRRINGVSITSLDARIVDDIYIVTASAMTRDGRTDQANGAVSIAGLKGEAKANAVMKAETKAKRRVTLSISGLGWLDESEAESIPGAQRVHVDQGTGEIFNQAPQPAHRQIEQQPEPAAHRAPQPAQTAPVAPVAADDILADKTLPEALLAFVGELRSQERPGAKKASEKQHNFGVGVVDGVTGDQTHRQVFKTIFRREVTNTPENRLSEAAFKLLLKYLSDKKSVKQGNEWVNVDNEDYSIERANMIRIIHNWAMETRGQMTIDQAAPDVEFESEGDRLFA